MTLREKANEKIREGLANPLEEGKNKIRSDGRYLFVRFPTKIADILSLEKGEEMRFVYSIKKKRLSIYFRGVEYAPHESTK